MLLEHMFLHVSFSKPAFGPDTIASGMTALEWRRMFFFYMSLEKLLRVEAIHAYSVACWFIADVCRRVVLAEHVLGKIVERPEILFPVFVRIITISVSTEKRRIKYIPSIGAFNLMVIANVLSKMILSLEAIVTSISATIKTGMTGDIALVACLMPNQVTDSACRRPAIRIQANICRMPGNSTMLV